MFRILEKFLAQKAPPLLTDLLDALLVFDPARRISAAHALSHPFLVNAEFRDAEMEGTHARAHALCVVVSCCVGRPCSRVMDSQRTRTLCSISTLNCNNQRHRRTVVSGGARCTMLFVIA